MNPYSPGIVLTRLLGEVEAKAAGFDAILPEHLWIGLTKLSELPQETVSKALPGGRRERQLLIAEIERLDRWFAEQAIDPKLSRRRLRRILGRGHGGKGRLHRNEASVRAFQEAMVLAGADASKAMDALHLGRAILAKPSPFIARMLAACGCSVLEGGSTSSAAVEGRSGGRGGPKALIMSRFGRDLTALASGGELDPVIGRKGELLRLAQILNRKRKGNALLVGDAGVGKTCVVEGLAQKIVSPGCPQALQGKRIMELSVASLVAGTKFRGDLEERIEGIVREAEQNSDVILFLDEFHTIMGKQGDGLDMANLVKPALARGKLHLIGATTAQEFERHLEKDEAIARRFEVLWIEEPSREEVGEIIRRLKNEFESHHGVAISDSAVHAAVELSIRYLPDRRLPDKALDLLDQACATKGLESLTMRHENGLDAAMAEPSAGDLPTVERADIARVLSQRVRIPFEMLAAADEERLGILETYLNRRIAGQQRAMRAIAGALQAASRGLKDPRRPVASFLLAGPTGVGKTESARALSEFLYGGRESLVRIDLSEYMEKHQVARLLGAPPGYVGSESPGLLTSALRQRPACVVLFDEVEKAHPDVLNVLLQILEEGELTDGHGRKAHFREAVVVLTTNLTPHVEGKGPIGFGVDGDSMPVSITGEAHLMAALQRHLRPELLGRIHDIVRFDPLDRDALAAIAERAFDKQRNRLKDRQMDVPKELLDRILGQVKTGPFGAREIERLVERQVAQWLERPGRESRSDVEVREERAADQEGEVLLSVMPEVPQMAAALLVLDLVQSTRFVRDSGDTLFGHFIGRIHRIFQVHDSANELLFLKCTGDGFLAVYRTISTALSVARNFLGSDELKETSIRIALHHGDVKTGPGGDPLGVEVHRVFRVEGVQEADRAEMESSQGRLCEMDRILATRQALDRMNSEERNAFQSAGSFRLKGFDEPCELWVACEVPEA